MYLKPLYKAIENFEEEHAATDFKVTIVDNHIPGLKDLAKGAGGKYRYIEKVNRLGEGQKVTAIHIRKKTGIGSGACTSDINEGRGGLFLYLCWDTGRVEY